jgi:hypothetical protein
MPDESQKITPASPSDSTFESLIAEAEGNVVVPVTRQERPCSHGGSANINVFHVCPTCKWPFCDVCGSALDPTYCHRCLNEPDAVLKELPLVDADGERREGRLLVPAPDSVYSPPRFMTLTKTISEMTKSELEDYVDQYKNLVIQAEKALDFRRIVLGTAQLEVNQREDAEKRRLRADKTKYPIKTVSVNPKTGKPKTSTASMVQLLEMMKALQALKKSKEGVK